jgi:hypothetical protein
VCLQLFILFRELINASAILADAWISESRAAGIIKKDLMHVPVLQVERWDAWAGARQQEKQAAMSYRLEAL